MGVTTTSELLRSLSGLAGLDEDQLERVAARAELISLSAGDWLFRAGEEPHAAYVVASGRLEVVAEDPGAPAVRVMRRGEAVGELALLRGARRSASIRAQRDSTLVSLDRDHFEGLLGESPAYALALTRSLSERLAGTLAPVRTAPRPRVIAVVALDRVADSAHAGEALVRELERFGKTACFRGAPTVEIADWPGHLARAEGEADRVVLLGAGSDPTEAWTAFCVAESDLLVAVTGDVPDGRWLAQPCALVGDAELVCLNASHSSEVLERLSPRGIRAVQGDDGAARAMRELAARICGRAVGVVLSGGGARAFSHLGVIEELTRYGVRIDRIGGVSLGGLVAASVARGDSAEERYAYCHRYFVEQNPASDYTLPLIALTRGRKLARGMEEVFGSSSIEGLQLPFFCVSTDLVRRRLVVHRAGSLSHALLATVSVPGVLPPVVDRSGRVLVDGGVLDNLPVSVMAEDAGGPVIAVDVTSARAGGLGPWHTAAMRDGRLLSSLRRRLTGSEVPLPRLQETIVRCMTLGSADTAARASRHADIVIAPDVANIGLLDWHRLPEAREAGARAARLALERQPDFFARL